MLLLRPRGGVIDPFSGKPIGPGNTCDAASAEEVARMNADVAARRYTGVADFADWPADVPVERYAGFWDPDEAAPTPGPYTDATGTVYDDLDGPVPTGLGGRDTGATGTGYEGTR